MIPEACWYEPNKDDPQDKRNRAVALRNETSRIEQRQSTWHDLNLWNAVLYTNRELPGFKWGSMAATTELFPVSLRSENLVEEIGSALVAKACSSPLKPTPVATGHSYKVERAVRVLDRFITAAWRHTRAEEAAVEAFLDAFISGIGAVRIAWDTDGECLTADSVFFDNIVVDNRESNNRQNPRHVRIRQVVPRSSVIAKYPHYLKEWDADLERYHEKREVAADWTVVIEAWRLPDGKGKGGRHSISCDGVMLVDEAWSHDWIPVVFFKWEHNVSGFLGRSGVEMLVPFQIIMNELNEDIRAGQDVACRPRMLYHTGSNLDFSQWDTEVGRMLGWSGIDSMRPMPLVWPSNMGELYNERDRVRQAAHMYMGLSTFSTQMEGMPGFRADSSMGVREFRNMEDARHLHRWTRFEAFRLDIAKSMMNVLAASKGADDYSVSYKRGRLPTQRIPYEEVKTLTDEQYEWQMEATPFNLTSPAAQREIVRDWTSRQLIDQAEAKRSTGVPNLNRIDDLEMASYDDILRHLDILESTDEEVELPDELTNLTYGIPRVAQNMHRLKWYVRTDDDFDPAIIDRHYEWILHGLAIQQNAAGTSQSMYAGMEGPVAFQPTQGMPGTSAAVNPQTSGAFGVG